MLFICCFLLCSLLTPFVSAKHAFFSAENGLVIFNEDFEGYESGVDVIDSIGEYWYFEDSNGLASDNPDFCLTDNGEGGKALYVKWIYGRLMKSTENITVKSPCFGWKNESPGR